MENKSSIYMKNMKNFKFFVIGAMVLTFLIPRLYQYLFSSFSYAYRTNFNINDFIYIAIDLAFWGSVIAFSFMDLEKSWKFIPISIGVRSLLYLIFDAWASVNSLRNIYIDIPFLNTTSFFSMYLEDALFFVMGSILLSVGAFLLLTRKPFSKYLFIASIVIFIVFSVINYIELFINNLTYLQRLRFKDPDALSYFVIHDSCLTVKETRSYLTYCLFTLIPFTEMLFIAFACFIKVKKAVKPPKYNISGPVMVMPTGGGNYQAVPVVYQPVYAQPQYTVPVQTVSINTVPTQTVPVNTVPVQNIQPSVVAPVSTNPTMNNPATAIPAPPPFNPTPAPPPFNSTPTVAPMQYAQPVVPTQQTPVATTILSDDATVILGDNTNDN